MKKYLILLFIFIQGLVFSATKSLSDIKTVKFDVVEKTTVKSKKKEISYKVDFELPNKIKKEVTAPELNKGEIYLYDYTANKKVVYLPLFNEVKENKIVDDENRIIKAINKIIEEEKKNKDFSQKYYSKKPQSLNIDEQVSIDILSYIEVDGYIFPEVVEIKDRGTKVADIKISNLKINPILDSKIFTEIPKNRWCKMIFLRGKGIIIAKKDIEEADRYITIFMEDYGKVSTVIKGIRKSKKRDKTAVDTLSLTDFQFYKKNDSLIISNFSTIKDYIGIKSDIDKINIAFYIFSILNQILVENGRNRKIYEILEKTLDYLNSSNDERKNYLLILYFLYIIIKEEGIFVEDGTNIEGLQIEVQAKRKVEIDKNVKKILKYLFEDNLKVVINDEKYKIDYVKKAILVLENYINFNLDININAQKILWGALLW